MERCFRFPTERFGTRRIQFAPEPSFGLRRIEDDIALVSDGVRDGIGEVAYRRLFERAYVDE